MIAEPKLLAPEQVLDEFPSWWRLKLVWAFTSLEMHPIWGEQEEPWEETNSEEQRKQEKTIEFQEHNSDAS